MHEYLFDVRLFAAIRVRATSEEDARKMLRDSVTTATAHLGQWPDGSPIVCEVSVDDDSPDLGEIDGELL